MHPTLSAGAFMGNGPGGAGLVDLRLQLCSDAPLINGRFASYKPRVDMPPTLSAAAYMGDVTVHGPGGAGIVDFQLDASPSVK